MWKTMDIVTKSLDALLHKATNTHNQNVDTAALEAFCALINKEKDGPHIGAKLLANGIHSKNEIEALNILTILDVCMKRCNNTFQSEIGKFRFLNEMIKLVSPKYLGTQTTLSIKQKVLQLLYIWTLDYPKETKIKEAYDMLKKQGVIRELPLSICADNAIIPDRRLNSSIFNDEEKNRLLQKLLQSKNPEDLQAANRLIKNMVKEDDKRAELKSRKITEVESINNSVRLLNEMLDSYKPEVSSRDELELIKELHQSCERVRPNIFKLIAETQQNEEILQEVLQTSDELGLVFDKYTDVIIKGNASHPNCKEGTLQDHSLLDLDSVVETVSEDNCATNNAGNEQKSDLDLLCDVFSLTAAADSILTPITSRKVEVESANAETCRANKLKALDDLNSLGQHLLSENLTKRIGSQFNKISDKIPLNELAKNSSENKVQGHKNKLSNTTINDALNLDLNYLVDKDNRNDYTLPKNNDLSGDDVLVDITEEKGNSEEIVEPDKINSSLALNKSSIKLSDIVIKLEDVKPSSMLPLVVLDERNGITVTFHFGKNKSHQDVSVIVVTTISKNELPISNFLFQVVVPKACKFKLQQPSTTELPAYNPFLPPSAITQIFLIANPEHKEISLKFIVSYTMDDETFTEMGDVENLPAVYC